jgi:RNA recognition motif-containing protein
MKIYLGNLLYIYTENDVKVIFEAHSEIKIVNFLFDLETNQFKLFDLV